MAVYASVDGIQIEYDPGYGEPSQLDQIVDAVKALSPELRKLLKKVGYDRIKAKGINDPGFTPDCPLGDQADIEINPDLSDDIKRTINHELGHALDDILGEQNGTGRYHNSNTFDAARVADGAAQATNPPAGIDPAEVAASNNFYDNNRAEFIADVNMAISEIAQGRGDTKSVYGQKLTAQQIAQLYPVSADVLKGQIQFALNRMADGGGAGRATQNAISRKIFHTVLAGLKSSASFPFESDF